MIRGFVADRNLSLVHKGAKMNKFVAAAIAAVCAVGIGTALWAKDSGPAEKAKPASAKAKAADAKLTPVPATAPAASQAAGSLKTDVDKLSYAIGMQIARGLKMDGLEINPKVFTQALTDVMGEKPLAMTDEEVRAVLDDVRSKIMARKEEEFKKASDDNQAKGEAFLEANKKEKGVKVTESGLQYKVIKSGTGKSPKASDNVTVHYEGKLLDGTVFDSSYERKEPQVFVTGRLIRGWTEALQMMKEGDVWELVIPAELAYGERGMGPIPPNSVLKFKVELIKVEPAAPGGPDTVAPAAAKPKPAQKK